MTHYKLWPVIAAILLTVAACSSTASPSPAATASPSTTGTALPSASAEPNDLLSRIKARGYILMSIQPNDPPAAMLQKDGTYLGFDIDVGKAIAQEIGVDIQYVTPDWGVTTAGQWSGRWDLSVQGMTITTKRQAFLDFSDPYRYITANFAASEASGITSVDQLAGKTICVGTGTTYQLYLQGQLDIGPATPKASPPPNLNIITNESETVCAEAWGHGRNDSQAWLTSVTTIENAIKAGLPVVMLQPPVFAVPLAAAADKAGLDDKRLVALVNSVLARMQKDGSLSALCVQWFGTDMTKPPSA